MAEQRFAKPTVEEKRRFLKSFAQDSSARSFPARVGMPEIRPKNPDTKENIDRHLNSASAQVEATMAPTAAENLPASQLVQTVDAIAAEYLPASHAVHGPPPGPLVPAVHLQS